MKESITLSIFVTVISLALTVSFSVFAADYDENMPATPANLTDRKSSLQNRIHFPDITEDITVLVLCNSQITLKGRFTGQVYCHRDTDIEDLFKPRKEEDEIDDFEYDPNVIEMEVTANRSLWLEGRFERAVVEASKYATLAPARFYGKRVEVKINFSVLFKREDGIEDISVFMHHFRNVDILGNDYISAQRLTGQNRYDGCPTIHVPVWIEAEIESNGSAYNASLFDAGFEDEFRMSDIDNCLDSFTTMIEKNLFVPIIYYGQYISTGTYVELFYEDVRDDNSDHLDELIGGFGTSGNDQGLGNFSSHIPQDELFDTFIYTDDFVDYTEIDEIIRD